ncbi:hypothetical protein CN150_34560 [Sinorhizobium meliloti]|nr:hypothetical protein CN150_34560 [Sinorhizobium meliloti]
MIRLFDCPDSNRGMHYETHCADRVKIVWWDGSGVCLYAKRLEKSQFCWPRIGHNRVQLNHAQLLALIDGMDWKRVRSVPVKPPEIVG